MSAARTLATAGRVLDQIAHDRRTLALLFIVPPALITLLKYVFRGESQLFGQLAPLLLGIFPLVMMFLVTSIATLRERTSGTLDRLLAMPMSKLDFILGYGLAFSAVGLAQAALTSLVMLGLLQVSVVGGTFPALVGAVAAAVLGTAAGLFTSAFAASEFQAVQFMPAFIFPQLLICGLFVPRDHMARLLQWLADVMPLSYSVDAMKQVSLYPGWGHIYVRDLAVVVLFALVFLFLGAATIRRSD